MTGTYPLQVVRYAEISANPKQKFRAGGESTTRDLNIVVGDNVTAGRILMGFTRSQQGNWTSWPPHEHTKMLEEVYVYFDMPPPAFGIQLVYTKPETPEFCTIVRDGKLKNDNANLKATNAELERRLAALEQAVKKLTDK